jgi:hypothetical protein
MLCIIATHFVIIPVFRVPQVRSSPAVRMGTLFDLDIEAALKHTIFPMKEKFKVM